MFIFGNALKEIFINNALLVDQGCHVQATKKPLLSTTVNDNFNDLTRLPVHASTNDYNSSSEKRMFWHPIILTQQISPVGWLHYKSSLRGGRDALPQRVLARTREASLDSTTLMSSMIFKLEATRRVETCFLRPETSICKCSLTHSPSQV